MVLLADHGGAAVRRALPPRGQAGGDHPADARRRGPAGRRGDPGRRQRARGRPEVLLPGRAVHQPGRAVAGLLHGLHGRRAVHDPDQGPGHRRGARGRGAGGVLRLRLGAGRVGAVLRDRRRRLAAVPGAAAHGRHPGGRRRDRVRGSRRAVLGRRGADPQRALPAHRRGQQDHQRVLAAGRGRPDRCVERGAAAPPGRGVQRRAPARGGRRPAADPAQRRRGELRAGHRAAGGAVHAGSR